MNPYIIYFRHEGIYNKDIAQAAVTDSFLADRMTKGARVATHTVSEDKNFSNGSKHVSVACEPCEIMLIGTIPYHLLVANLYHLEEKGFKVFIDSNFITTDVEAPNYPPEFVRDASA